MPHRAPTHKPMRRAAPVHASRDSTYTAAQRGYGSRWQKARAGWLASHPLCVMCERDGRVTEATVVDHVVPHRLAWALASGDAGAIAAARARFWDRDNWQSLCKAHHDGVKQALENAARRRGGSKV